MGLLKGFVSFSARLPDYTILGVFTGQLAPGSDEIKYSYHDGYGVLQTISIPWLFYCGLAETTIVRRGSISLRHEKKLARRIAAGHNNKGIVRR